MGPVVHAEDCTFERGVYRVYPDLRRSLSKLGEPLGIWYSVMIRPEQFEPREVDALVPFNGEDPLVFADGPEESPHRYYVSGRGCIQLCMWFPQDPREAQWRYADGLLALLGHARTHLIREGYYRQDLAKYGTEKWLGPEARHGASALKRTPE